MHFNPCVCKCLFFTTSSVTKLRKLENFVSVISTNTVNIGQIRLIQDKVNMSQLRYVHWSICPSFGPSITQILFLTNFGLIKLSSVQVKFRLILIDLN